jgi:hypothetical protein
MKIGILTLPLHTNYGGILQAYALKTYLDSIGHEVWLINNRFSNETAITHIKEIAKILLRKKELENQNRIMHEISKCKIDAFVSKHFYNNTFIIKSPKDFKFLDNLNFNAYIVGSDQVWRKSYVKKNIDSYYLKFANGSNKILLSYAASFGIDKWNFSSKEENRIRLLIQGFNAVSVREGIGKEFCKSIFNIDAEQLVDPTLLLSSDHYYKLFSPINDINAYAKDKLAYYILDSSPSKKGIINNISNYFNLDTISIGKIGQDGVFPSIEEWLAGFHSARFIVTDSFHGCVFSILFNKPFVAIANSRRGINRFTSLLSIFGLLNRLVVEEADNDTIDDILSTSIDWDFINSKIKSEVLRSNQFLIQNLKK